MEQYSCNEPYALNWTGKAAAYRVIQERTAATLIPQPELSANFDTAENIFIEGENLDALKVLQTSYNNKVKCIIIDPPYNTWKNNVIYSDRFKENKENGDSHSNWLNMMLPRLSLARDLMSDDGVIFVHIDDNEAHNLRLVMNEVFGEENFVAQIVWEYAYAPVNLRKHFSKSHEYILFYAKQINNLVYYGSPRLKSTWTHREVGHYQDSMRELRALFDGEKIFDYPKPVTLTKQLISLYSQENDLILDFFAGSATTAHAVIDLNNEDGGNRKFILVQLAELCDKESETYKAGYKTIADISRERIRRVIRKLDGDTGNLGFKSYYLKRYGLGATQ